MTASCCCNHSPHSNQPFGCRRPYHGETLESYTLRAGVLEELPGDQPGTCSTEINEAILIGGACSTPQVVEAP